MTALEHIVNFMREFNDHLVESHDFIDVDDFPTYQFGGSNDNILNVRVRKVVLSDSDIHKLNELVYAEKGDQKSGSNYFIEHHPGHILISIEFEE